MSVPPPFPGGALSLGRADGPAAAEPVTADRADRADRASIWPRIGAYLVDAGIAGLGATGCLLLAGGDISAGLVNLPYLGLFMAWWLAVRVQGARVAGESPGKRLAGLRVVTPEGAPIGTRARLLREGPLMLPYLVPLVAIVDALIAEGGERRSTRDRVARTVVVRVPGARTEVLRIVLLVVATGLTSVLLIEPHVSERAGLDRARREMVGDCARSGNIQRSTCTCVYDVLERRVPKSDLLQAAADRRSSMPYDPDVLVVINAAFTECRGLPAGGRGSSV